MAEIMSRAEHIAWAKKRALKYLESNNLKDAFISMLSDLKKHDELKHHIGIDLGWIELVTGMLQDSHRMRHWIEGFN